MGPPSRRRHGWGEHTPLFVFRDDLLWLPLEKELFCKKKSGRNGSEEGDVNKPSNKPLCTSAGEKQSRIINNVAVAWIFFSAGLSRSGVY